MSAPNNPASTKVHLGLGGTFVQVDADADLITVANDANCLLKAAMGAIDQMTDHACSDGAPQEVSENWWAMLYTLRAGLGAFDRLYELAHKNGGQT